MFSMITEGGPLNFLDVALMTFGNVRDAHPTQTFAEHWQPRTVGQIYGHDMMAVKVKGEFVWHKYDNTNDFFLVLSGRITIKMRERDITLGPGEGFVVPKDVEHRRII